MPISLRLALLGAGSVLLLACGKDAGSSTTTTSAAAPPAHPTATAAPPPATATATATAVATAAPAGGGACSIVGEWTGTYPPGPYPFSGTPFDISFKADGAGLTKSQRADNEFAWTVEGGTL